jgi:hypothetical protein
MDFNQGYRYALREEHRAEYVSLTPDNYPYNPNKSFSSDDVRDFVVHNMMTASDVYVRRYTRDPVMGFNGPRDANDFVKMAFGVNEYQTLGFELIRVY